MRANSYTGINIQFPISRLILEGRKTIETRTYPIPKHLVGETLLIIETPGKSGQFKSRVIGYITFSECFKYQSKQQFYEDSKFHCVTTDSKWAWNENKGKWGWKIQKVKPLKKEIPLHKRNGIVYTKNISL